MAQVTLTARVDKHDKAKFSALCSNIGLNTSDSFFSKTNMAYVKKSVQELRSGKGTPHELIEVGDE
ncbi:MAG: type II toxin-antitoxin system antitoxin, RelB/DinJ family [Lachnospiraceae bacterium]|nr:type II toxin-antitoxin system antitoxin, RelB/DinJ family [Lachnospiraceae bacterium]